MKSLLSIMLIFLFHYDGLSQSTLTALTYERYVDSLTKIKSVPISSNKKSSCGDKLYWDIVKLGPDVIPILVKKISDTTLTSIKIPCRETYLRIGDLAYLLIDEIIAVPLALVTKMQWCLMEIGCDFGQPMGTFEYLNNNRLEFSRLLLNWFNKYKNSFQKRELTANAKKRYRSNFGINYIFDCEY